MRYVIEHDTRLVFAQPVREQHCELRLVPPDTSAQRVHSAVVTVEPTAKLRRYTDYFGNTVEHGSVAAPHTQLLIHLQADVETLLHNPFDYPIVPAAREAAWIAARLKAEPRLWDYVLYHSPATPDLTHCAPPPDSQWPRHDPERQLVDSVLAAAHWIAATFELQPGDAEAPPLLERVVKARAGDGSDLAHLLVALVRSWGFPARFVTGYRDPAYLTEDGSDPPPELPHAWAEVLIPGAGWRGCDPSTQLIVNDTYVVQAVGRDAHDALPVRTSYTGGDGGDTAEVELRVVAEAGAAQ